MSILLICNHKDPAPWAASIKKNIPGEKVEIYPNIESPEKVDFIICWKPHPNFLATFPNVKAIQSLGAGVDHIFMHNKIPVSVQVARILDPQLSEDMWEFLLALVMSHLKDLPTYQQQQQQQFWHPHPYQRINEVTISILGLGAIGGFVARKLADLGFNVQGWSKSIKRIQNVKSYIGDEGLQTILSNTNILINLLPLTPSTNGVLDRSVFNQLPVGSFLINAGRGEHLIEEDLLFALQTGKISSCALDVFSEEPLPTKHVFWDHPKIKITPHIAAITSMDKPIGIIAENWKRLKNGDQLIYLVSNEALY